jgi:hypothetical protein
MPVLLLGKESDPAAAGDDDESTVSTTTTVPLPGVPGTPEARFHGFATSVAPGRVVVFGGATELYSTAATPIDDTWLLDPASGQWYDLEPGTTPGPRHEPAVAYDSESGVIVLFGGGSGPQRWCSGVRRCSTPALDDIWAFDLALGTWIPMQPETRPPARFGAAAVYDAGSDRIVLFGGARVPGSNTSEALADTWAYDVNTDTWTEMSPETSPGPRAYAAATYDPVADRVLVFSGDGVDIDIGISVWAYDVDADVWEERPAPEVGPAQLWDAMLTYVPELDLSLLIGGEGPITREIAEGVSATEIEWSPYVWAYNAAENVWLTRTDLEWGLSAHAAAFDEQTGRIVVVIDEVTSWYDPFEDEWSEEPPGEE